MSPTALTLRKLRTDGCMAAVVERWNHFARVRQDLFGFIDIVAVVPGAVGVLGVQACVTGDAPKRFAKCRAEPLAANVRRWLAAGNAFAVWGWAKRGPRGKRKVWTLKEYHL